MNVMKSTLQLYIFSCIRFFLLRLIQYDCGKLQRLDLLLSDLLAGQHRALIFTQMTKVLDILERFLNYHGYRYLRLDGTTRVDRRLVRDPSFSYSLVFLELE